MIPPTWAPAIASARALPRWGVYAAAAAALVLLVLFVATVQSSVQRGESLQQARQAADATALVTRYAGRPAVAQPARR